MNDYFIVVLGATIENLKIENISINYPQIGTSYFGAITGRVGQGNLVIRNVGVTRYYNR